MEHRAYAILDVKELSDESDVVRIKGIASTPTTDRMGDVVEPMGARFKTPMPLLWQHRHDSPVGHVVFAKPTKAGIPFEATLPIIKEAGRLKERVDEAIHSLRYRLVAAVSIGFAAVEGAIERIETGLRFKEWEWLELSLVTIPANSEATITAIKSIDAEQRAASGLPGDDPPPRVVGNQDQPAKRGFFFAHSKDTKMKTYQERIQTIEAAKSASLARMNEIQEKAMAEGRAKDAEERQQFDDLAAEIKGYDSELADLKLLEQMSVAKAVPVQGETQKAASASRGPTIIVAKHDPDEQFKGQNFTRRVIAKALAYLSQGEATAAQIAEMRWGKQFPQLVQVIKASVAGGSSGTGTGDWGGELVSADNRYTGDFIEYLNSRTVFNQLPLREVPAHVTIKGQDGNATGYWVGESKGIPVTKADFMDVTLTPLKVAALAVISNELIRDSSPSAEMLVRDALVEAAAQRIDTTFLSTSAAVNGVSPAGLLNGLSAGSASGTDADALRADIATLYAGFITAKNATNLAWVMGPSLAKQISLMRNALGQREFPDMTQMGGTLEGDPVYTGDNVGAGDFILLKPSDIYKIGDGGVQVSMSREATIEQADNPAGASDTPVAQANFPVNMFQTESTAIKVVRSMNFAKRRSTAVAYIGDADYGSGAT